MGTDQDLTRWKPRRRGRLVRRVRALSPVHGNPLGGTVGDRDSVPYTTPEMVRQAHEADMLVIPRQAEVQA